MPLYFGHPASQSKQKRIEVSSALKEQGIELLRAVPSQVNTHVLPFVESPLWAAFTSILSCVILSVSSGLTVPTNLAGFPVDTKHPRPLPIRFPDLCLQVTNPGPIVHGWLLDNNFEEQEIRGNQYYLLPSPSSTVLDALLHDDCPVQFKDNNYTPLRYTNMGALFVFSEMVNLLSFVSQVLSISMWKSPVKRGDLLKASDNFKDTSAGDDIQMYDPARPIEDEDVSPAPEGRTHPISQLFSNPSELPNYPSSESQVDASSLSSMITWSPLSTMMSVPNLGEGILSRYVVELSDDDPFGVPNFFVTYLRRSLGASASEILETIDRFKSAWGVLKSTSSGHVLSHIVKSMEIAILAHCSFTPIFDRNFYEGALIRGLGFVVSTRSEIHVPLSTDDLLDELKQMETHQRSLAAIKQLLVKAGMKTEDWTDELDDMDILRQILLRAPLNDNDRQEIKNLAGKLRFPVRKWSINLGSLNLLFDLLLRGLDIIDRSYPIGPEGLFSSDPLEIAMSCFTKNGCPSFRHPSGVPIDLRASKPPSPPADVKRGKSKGPQRVNNGAWVFSVRRVDFEEAVSDFRILVRDGEARSMSSSSARGLGYFVVSGGNFEGMFMKLRACLDVSVQSGTDKPTDSDPLQSRVSKRVLSGDIPGGAMKRQRRIML